MRELGIKMTSIKAKHQQEFEELLHIFSYSSTPSSVMTNGGIEYKVTRKNNKGGSITDKLEYRHKQIWGIIHPEKSTYYLKLFDIKRKREYN